MTRYVAFLRAINVGGHTVRMDELRRQFELAGAANVESFIASGNIIFDTPRRNAAALERAIADHLHAALGFPVATFLRTIPELAAVAAHRPFPEAEFAAGATMYVAFMRNEPDKAVRQAVLALRNPVDDLALRKRELYWLREDDGCRRHVLGRLVLDPQLTPARRRDVRAALSRGYGSPAAQAEEPCG